MTLGDVKSQARKLHRRSVKSGLDIPLRWWAAALYAQYLLPEATFVADTPKWTLNLHGLLIRVISHDNTYKFVALTPEQYDMLGDCDRIIFVKSEQHTTRISAKWVDVKVVRDTAKFFYAGERHDDALRPFNTNRWIVEATHLNEMDSFTPESV